MCQASSYTVTAIKWIFAEKQMKGGFFLTDPRFPIAIGHRELIQVGKQSQGLVIDQHGVNLSVENKDFRLKTCELGVENSGLGVEDVEWKTSG